MRMHKVNTNKIKAGFQKLTEFYKFSVVKGFTKI